MKIYIVRHGETPWNIERKLQGQSNTELNEFGCILAVKTGIGMKDIAFDKVYSSPLIRSYKTTELIVAENVASENIEIISDDRLKEIGFGVFEGMCCSETGWNIPDESFHNFFDNCEAYTAPEGGESFEVFTKRIEEFLKDLFEDVSLQDKTILVSTHGAMILGLLNYIEEKSLADFWRDGVHKNCAVSVVSYDGIKPVIEVENMVYYDDEVPEW